MSTTWIIALAILKAAEWIIPAAIIAFVWVGSSGDA